MPQAQETSEEISMEQYLASFPTPLEGLEALGLANLVGLVDAVDVLEESTAADMLAEALAMASSEHGITNAGRWLSKHFGLSKGRVMQVITHRPIGVLHHHLRHVAALNLSPGYRFQQLVAAWDIIENVEEGFLFGESLRSNQERLDTTYDPYLPGATSHELFWLCFHASLDDLVSDDLRKHAEDQARRLFSKVSWPLSELWASDPYPLADDRSLAEFVRNEIRDPHGLNDEDIFPMAILKRYDEAGYSKLF